MKGILPSKRLLAGLLTACLAAGPLTATAAEPVKVPPPAAKPQQPPDAERKELLQKVSEITGIPWPLLAAVNRYEYTMNKSRKKTLPKGLSTSTFRS